MLKPLKQAPSSSRWDLAAVRNGYRYWRSNNGKLFAEHVESGKWFQVVKQS